MHTMRTCFENHDFVVKKEFKLLCYFIVCGARHGTQAADRVSGSVEDQSEINYSNVDGRLNSGREQRYSLNTELSNVSNY